MMDVRPVLRPDDWTLLAACRGSGDLFFAPDDVGEGRAERRDREDRAKAICGVCDVRTECLQESLAASEAFGIWGGLTERERRTAHRNKDCSPHDIAGPGRLSSLPAVVVQGRPMSPSVGGT